MLVNNNSFMGKLQTFFFLCLLIFISAPAVSAAGAIVYKNADWVNDTNIVLTDDNWDIVPAEDFHAYQAHEETQLLYCDDAAEECRPLWRLALQDLGITNLVLGWYDSLSSRGDCERGVCARYLTDEEKSILEADGFQKYCDTSWSYPCSGVGTYTDCVACVTNHVTDCQYDFYRWAVRCQGTCKYGGYDVGACELIDNFCFDHRTEVTLDDTCRYYKDHLSEEDVARVYNHTSCWIEGSSLRWSGNDISKYYKIVGAPSIHEGYISCLINYSDWQEQASDDQNHAADQIGPGSKLYFDFTGQINAEPDCYENSDCGETYWTGDSGCCNDEGWNICRAYHGYECRNPGEENAYCFEWDGYKQVEECFNQCQNNTCQADIEPEEPSNETNITDPPVVPEEPDEPDCENCVNVSEIADIGIEAITSIKQELLLAAQVTDAKVGGTAFEFSECFYNLFIDSSNPASLGFKTVVAKDIFQEFVFDALKGVFYENAYEAAVNDVYIPELEKIAKEIQGMNFTQVNNTEFTQDVKTYFEYLKTVIKSNRESTEEIVASANQLKFKIKLTLLGSKIIRMLVVGSVDAAPSVIQSLKFANEAGSDIESCFWENYYTQVNVNYVLSMQMKNNMETAISAARIIKETMDYLNYNTETPSITVAGGAFGGSQYAIRNEFSDLLSLSVYSDINDITVQPYCGAVASGLPLLNFSSKLENGTTMQINESQIYSVEYEPLVKEALGKINLQSYCPVDRCYGSAADISVKIVSKGDVYVAYGDGRPMAAKRMPFTQYYTTYLCKKASVTPSSGGGGGGGGGSPNSVMTKSQPPTSTAPAVTGLFGGFTGSDKTDAKTNTPKVSQDKKEVKTEPKKEEQKQTAPKKEVVKQTNPVIETVKSISNFFFQPVIQLLKWFRII